VHTQLIKYNKLNCIDFPNIETRFWFYSGSLGFNAEIKNNRQKV